MSGPGLLGGSTTAKRMKLELTLTESENGQEPFAFWARQTSYGQNSGSFELLEKDNFEAASKDFKQPAVGQAPAEAGRKDGNAQQAAKACGFKAGDTVQVVKVLGRDRDGVKGLQGQVIGTFIFSGIPQATVRLEPPTPEERMRDLTFDCKNLKVVRRE